MLTADAEPPRCLRSSSCRHQGPVYASPHRSLRTDPTTRPRLGGHFKPFVLEFGEVLIELGAVTGSNGIARNTPFRETSKVHSWGHSRGSCYLCVFRFFHSPRESRRVEDIKTLADDEQHFTDHRWPQQPQTYLVRSRRLASVACCSTKECKHRPVEPSSFPLCPSQRPGVT
jgi:hypothetical protein